MVIMIIKYTITKMIGGRNGMLNPRTTSDAHACPVLQLQVTLPAQLFPVYILGMVFHSVGYLFGQLRSAVLALLASCALPHWQSMGDWKAFDLM